MSGKVGEKILDTFFFCPTSEYLISFVFSLQERENWRENIVTSLVGWTLDIQPFECVKVPCGW